MSWKKLGDGLMALFGYPQAQENDAERAVRAALAIQRALAERNARNAGKGMPALSARIGIESGAVVVDATGEVFGDAPNVTLLARQALPIDGRPHRSPRRPRARARRLFADAGNARDRRGAGAA